jgi:hypothetical protein
VPIPIHSNPEPSSGIELEDTFDATKNFFMPVIVLLNPYITRPGYRAYFGLFAQRQVVDIAPLK